jgi:cytochrome c-type biogenesis protein CcmE
VIAEKGAVDDREQARREMARPDGYVEVNGDMRFDVADGIALAAGQFNLLQEAKAEIDASGVNPAIEGDASAPSGRAQEMMMASGLAEMAGVFEALRDWSWEVYRQVWFRIRQYWTDEKWIRVTDDERNMRWVAINRPMTQADLMIEQAEQSGQPLDPQRVAQLRADPMMQQVSVQNPLGELDVDLILEDGPDSVNLQSEQYQSLVDLKRADPASIPTRMIIEASSLRNKDQILEHLDSGGIPPQVQQQMQEMQQALQQAQQAVQESEQKAQEAQADNAIKVAELNLKQQELAIRQEELGIERYRAETERLTAIRPDPEPQQTPPPSGVFVG